MFRLAEDDGNEQHGQFYEAFVPEAKAKLKQAGLESPDEDTVTLGAFALMYDLKTSQDGSLVDTVSRMKEIAALEVKKIQESNDPDTDLLFRTITVMLKEVNKKYQQSGEGGEV